MFNQEQYEEALAGLTVQDAVILLQLIHRFTKSGAIEPVELFPLGAARTKLVNSILGATGVNYDTAQAPAAPAQSASATGTNI